MYPPKSEIFISFLNFNIYYYGIIMAFAIFIGFVTMKIIAKKYYPRISKNILSDLVPITVIFGLIGGRLYYILLDLSYYIKNSNEIFAIWHGGLSIHGAIIGGLLSGIIYLKYKKEEILPYCDIFAYGLLIGQAIGRWGNYFNSEAFGLPICTKVPWKLFVPISDRPIEFIDIEFFHPAFLYESIWNIIVFLFIFNILRKIVENKYHIIENNSSDGYGFVFFSYLILYSIGRTFIEFIRIDSIKNFFGVPIAVLVSIILIVISFIFIVKLNKKYNHIVNKKEAKI